MDTRMAISGAKLANRTRSDPKATTITSIRRVAITGRARPSAILRLTTSASSASAPPRAAGWAIA